MPTAVIVPSEAKVFSANSDFATALSGSGLSWVFNSTSSSSFTGFTDDGEGTNDVREVFHSFDLSTVPAGSTITSATLTYTPDFPEGLIGATVFQSRAYSWTPPGSTALWRTPPQLAALPVLATRTITDPKDTSWEQGVAVTLTNSGTALVDAVTANAGSRLTTVLTHSSHAVASPTAGNKFVGFFSPLYGFTSDRPKLTVVYEAAGNNYTVTASRSTTSAITTNGVISSSNSSTRSTTASITAAAAHGKTVATTSTTTASITAAAAHGKTVAATSTTTATITANATVTSAPVNAEALRTTTATITSAATGSLTAASTRTTTAAITATAALGTVAATSTTTATVTANAVLGNVTATASTTATITAAATQTKTAAAAITTTVTITVTASQPAGNTPGRSVLAMTGANASTLTHAPSATSTLTGTPTATATLEVT